MIALHLFGGRVHYCPALICKEIECNQKLVIENERTL